MIARRNALLGPDGTCAVNALSPWNASPLQLQPLPYSYSYCYCDRAIPQAGLCPYFTGQ